MTRPRVLVVRSGLISGVDFPRPRDPEALELVEKMSHSVDSLSPDLEPLREPAQLAVFTSQIAVGLLLDDPVRRGLFRECLSSGRVAAVGEVTAATLRERGVDPAIVAAGSGANVLDRLPARLDGLRVLLPCGEDATADLPETLHRRGARLAPLVLYRKTPMPRDAGLQQEIVERPFAAFSTTSPSAAQWLFAGAGVEAMERLRRTPAVVLGRFTGRYLESRGIARIEFAAEPTFSSLLEGLEELAAASQPA